MSFKKGFCFILILLFIFSCGKSSEKTDNIYKFRTYISYTTSGVVSARSQIKVTLAKPIDDLDAVKEKRNSLFNITPHVEGSIEFPNHYNAVFTPDEPLDPDTEYTVTFKLDDCFKSLDKTFKEYTFQFKTITPNFIISTNSLQSYSKDWQYINANLKSADIISIQQAKQLVEASQNNTDLKISWDENKNESDYFNFKIDSIKRNIEDSKITIKWDGKPIKASSKGEEMVTIPGKNNFVVTNTEVVHQPNQHIIINFSDPLQKNQNFKGLVTLNGITNLNYIVDGNLLKVYPRTKLVGDYDLNIYKGIKSEDGFKLKTQHSETIYIEALKPEVRLIDNGVFLPNSKALTFNFEAVNLKKVDVRIIKIFEKNVLQFLQENNISSQEDYEINKVGRRIAKSTITLIEDENLNTGKWKAYSIDLSKYISAEPGAIYRVELSIKQEYAIYDCNENNYSNEDNYYRRNISPEKEEQLEEDYWDNLTYSYKNNNYNWRDKDNPCTVSYYNYYKRTISQNLIGSNIGVIAKKGNLNQYVFATTNILTTKPESNTEITLYNYQQQEVAKGKSDSKGFATITSKQNVAFAIAKKNNNYSYIKLNDGNALSVSKFNVSGKKLQKGLKGYLYGERGVWRPGDSLFLTFILNDAQNKLPENHPVKLEIKNPVGKLVFKKTTSENTDNFYNYIVPTSTNFKTGNYHAVVSVGGAKFSKILKIENVKPNRLKINLDFNKNVLLNNKIAKGTLSVNWLHGTPAKQIKTEVIANFSNKKNPFKSYSDYTFTDQTRRFNDLKLEFFNKNTDNSGLGDINKLLLFEKNTPGMLNANFLIKAFEKGGDFSIDTFKIPFSPYSNYVGLRIPEGNRYDALNTSQNYTFDVITLNENETPVKRTNLKVNIYKIEWRWWWNSDEDNLSSYISNNYHKPVKSYKINTNSNGKANFKLNIDDNERGRYLIRIEDTESGHATSEVVYFFRNWWQNTNSADKDAAKMLVFKAEKDIYNVGETAKIVFPSAQEGNALLSIENGSEVITQQWVKTNKGETTVEIPITKTMTPNIFVNISLLQPHATTDNDLPLRLYGIIPIKVVDKNTQLSPVINLPKTIKPESEYTIKVSEENKNPMTYTLAVVEEGLLDLTRFKTPDAWKHFYTPEALGVKTWDIFDEVIGAYSGSIDQVFAIGGDGNAAKGKNLKANRFKPVVTYLGPFTLKSGETKKHKLRMPNYIGSVRAMVISGDVSKEAYGSSEQTAKVKKPLMVLSSLPRKLSPGEKVTLPVTVFALDKKISSVNVKLKLSDGISVVGKNTKTVNFKTVGEKLVYFDLEIGNTKGIKTIEVFANSKKEKASSKTEIDVTNPNPISHKVIDLELEPNANNSKTLTTFGVNGTNSASIEFSTIPQIDFSRRLQYLIRYPHGCVEQTTSSVFPQLFLSDIFDLTSEKKKQIQKNIKKGINRLGNFQLPNGGLSYWIGQSSPNDWGTSYAGHFMIEAEKKGYVLPLTFKTNWIRYQKQAAQNWSPSYTYNNHLSQAYRLYTLALAGQPDLASMNRLREIEELSNNAKWRLAAAYALIGQKNASISLIRSANSDFNVSNNSYYNYGSKYRNTAMALETMILTSNKNIKVTAKEIANALSSDEWMSTQTTAYCLLSISKMIENNGGKNQNIQYKINGKSYKIKSNNTVAQRSLNIKDGENTLTFKNLNNNRVYVRIINSGKLKLGEELTFQNGFNINVSYKDLDGNVLDVSNLEQGESFTATIKATNLTNRNVRDIALTQIFPSGWEIINTRFTDYNTNNTSNAEYTDFKDDRVNFYFNLSSKQTKQFTVMLNASYLGNFYLPGTQAEAMYNNDYNVRTKGKWITVIKK